MNKLCPNVAKTKLMFFSQRSQILPPAVYFNNVILEWVTDFKYLGIFIDNRLSFSTHSVILSRRISSVLGIISSARHLLNTQALTTIYYSLVYSIVNSLEE